MILLAALLALGQAPAAGDAAGSAVAQDSAAVVEKSADEPVAKAEVATAAQKNAPAKVSNQSCSCAPERFVRGAFGHYWADDATPEHVAPRAYALAPSFFAEPTSIAKPPLVPMAVFTDAQSGSSTHRLFRVDDAEVADGEVLALVRDSETTPREVQKRIALDKQKHAAAETIWLGPRFEKAHPSCGTYETLPLFAAAASKARRPDAYVVELTSAAGEKTRQVIDERHARTFGVGRVDACGHGATLPDGEFTATVFGLDVQTGVQTGPFTYAVAADGAITSRNEDLSDDDNPFLSPMPGRTLGNEEDQAALMMMLGTGGGAFAFAFVLWPLLRRRRRYVADVECPSCDAVLSLDLKDPKTDGMFCPKCGDASIFIRLLADGAPLATVVKLDKDTDTKPA